MSRPTPTAEQLQFQYECTLYAGQKSMALKRGLEWHFTREEWFAWWVKNLGPQWYDKRGRRAHEYCMSRKGDQGPYAPWNVECITNRANCILRKTNRPRKLTGSQARFILKHKGRLPGSFLGKLFNVSEGTIYNIWKMKRNYGRFLERPFI